MIEGTHSFNFNSDEITFVDYCSSSRKNGTISTAPFLHIQVNNENILIRGKKHVKKLLSIIVEDYDKLPQELWDFLMSEYDCLDNPDAPRFLDEMIAIKGDSKPCFLSVVVLKGGVNPLRSRGVWDGYSAISIQASSQESPDFNINWLADFMPVDFKYGNAVWRGSNGNRVIPVAESKLPTVISGLLSVYDFGKSYGVSSRFTDNNLRPHPIIEVLKDGDCLTNLKKAVLHSLSEASRGELYKWFDSDFIQFHNTDKKRRLLSGDYTDDAIMLSLEVDKIEYLRFKELNSS